MNKPNIYYDVSDYVRRSTATYTLPLLQRLMAELGTTESQVNNFYTHSDHIMSGCIMGTDPSTSVVDADCRAHDHENLFLPGGGAMTTGGSGNSTLTMVALAMKASDAIVGQAKAS